MDRSRAPRTAVVQPAKPDDTVEIRISGPDDVCRELLAALNRVARTTAPRGPYPRRDGHGVLLYCTAEPIRFMPEPGS